MVVVVVVVVVTRVVFEWSVNILD